MTTCVQADDHGTRCARIASHLVQRLNDVRRVAKKANRSAEMFERYDVELRAAKDSYGQAVRNRDAHMAECPAARERWSE